MGRTYRRNDRWKTDRRDFNFKKSKKFKKLESGIKDPIGKPKVIDPIINENDD